MNGEAGEFADLRLIAMLASTEPFTEVNGESAVAGGNVRVLVASTEPFTEVNGEARLRLTGTCVGTRASTEPFTEVNGESSEVRKFIYE